MRHDLSFLYGFVTNAPRIVTNEDGSYQYGMVYISVIRGKRDVGDNLHYIKVDSPLIMTQEPEICKKMETLKEGDIVYIKGVIACKNINKTSFCSNEECKEKNVVAGSLVYVNPLYLDLRGHEDSKEKCIQHLQEHQEISNEAYVLGTLCRDPKKINTKNSLVVTQYQIALNRKYRIRTDPPEIKSDYPWVKSYGENAVEDRKRLHVGSVVFIDGYLQARTVHRKTICPHCGKPYIWNDKAMEIVPYETEYMPGTFYTDEEIEANEAKKLEDIKKSIFFDPNATAEAAEKYGEYDQIDENMSEDDD